MVEFGKALPPIRKRVQADLQLPGLPREKVLATVVRLLEITGQDFTAKDFRTWAGTVECVLALEDIGTFESKTQGKKNVVAAIKTTAKRLGNRPATCRNYYVHPAVLDSYLDGTLLPAMTRNGEHPSHSETRL